MGRICFLRIGLWLSNLRVLLGRRQTNVNSIHLCWWWLERCCTCAREKRDHAFSSLKSCSAELRSSATVSDGYHQRRSSRHSTRQLAKFFPSSVDYEARLQIKTKQAVHQYLLLDFIGRRKRLGCSLQLWVTVSVVWSVNTARTILNVKDAFTVDMQHKREKKITKRKRKTVWQCSLLGSLTASYCGHTLAHSTIKCLASVQYPGSVWSGFHRTLRRPPE